MKINIKSKLLFLTIVPSLIIVLFSFEKVANEFKRKQDLDSSRRYITEAKIVSKIVHFMQIERGLSTEFVSKDIKDENLFLLNARKDLDIALKDLTSIYHRYENLDSNFSKSIIEIRAKIDIRVISASEVQKYYTRQLALLLDFTKVIPTMMQDREDRNHIQAYSYLSFAKENLGQIRAALQEVFISKSLLQENIMHAKRAIHIYHAAINRFEKSLHEHPQLFNMYKDILNDENSKEIFKIIESTLNSQETTTLHIDPAYWFKAVV